TRIHTGGSMGWRVARVDQGSEALDGPDGFRSCLGLRALSFGKSQGIGHDDGDEAVGVQRDLVLPCSFHRGQMQYLMVLSRYVRDKMKPHLVKLRVRVSRGGWLHGGVCVLAQGITSGEQVSGQLAAENLVSIVGAQILVQHGDPREIFEGRIETGIEQYDTRLAVGLP